MVSTLIAGLALFLLLFSIGTFVRLVVQERRGRRRRERLQDVQLPYAQVMVVSPGEFNALKAAIDNPQAPSHRLIRAAQRHVDVLSLD